MGRMRWKGRTLGLCLCLCLTGGCKAEQGEKKGEDQREELVLWSYYETKEQQTALDELIKGFNEAQEEYAMTWEYQGPVTEFNRQIAVGITQDEFPDMIILDNPDMRQYVEQGRLEDLTEEILDFEGLENYYPNVLTSVVYDGRYYGMPFCCNNTALIYNKDMLAEKGLSVPVTWEEFLDCAKSLTDQDTYGFAMSAIEGEQSAFQILPFILSAGDTIDTVGGEGTQAAFTLIQELAQYGAMSKSCINLSQNDVAKMFIEGKCAMMENGSWVLPVLDQSGVDYGIGALPYKNQPAGVAGGENIGVLKGKNVEGAVTFLRYYNEGSVMLNTNLRANSLPPRKDTAQLMLNVRPEYEIFASQMNRCISRSSYENWPVITKLLSDAQYEIITGQAEPEEICRRIREER